jgi:hypothetical protein
VPAIAGPICGIFFSVRCLAWSGWRVRSYKQQSRHRDESENETIVIVTTRNKNVKDYTLESKQDNKVLRDSGGTLVQVAGK